MKKVLITGGSKGLGLSIGNVFNHNGWDVINISRTPSPFTNIVGDLSTSAGVLEVISRVQKNHSSFDLLIFNAAMKNKSKIGEIDFNISQMFHINILSIIQLVDGLIDLIIKNKADIVIIGSKSSFESFADNGVYSASKHAGIGFINSLRNQLNSAEIRVLGFHPCGFTSNGKQDGLINSSDLAKTLFQIICLPKNLEVSEIIFNRIN